MRGAEIGSGHQPALHSEPCHSLHPQRQCRIEPVLETQVKNSTGRGAQRQCAKRVDKQSRHQSGQPFNIVKFSAQHRATPLNSERACYKHLAHTLAAHQPVAQPAAPRRLRCASTAPRNWPLVIQPCSSIASPSGIRCRCVPALLVRASSSRNRAASTTAFTQVSEQHQPPSKTGAVRGRKSFSQPEEQPGLAQVVKIPVRAATGTGRAANDDSKSVANS